jgi:hypothetical protein
VSVRASNALGSKKQAIALEKEGKREEGKRAAFYEMEPS